MKNINTLTQSFCDLYEGAGFKKFKMRKFEEYSLYLENKNFLTSEYVITFNDLSGKLLALKPDVTLSIVKNTKAGDGKNEKLYYTESVYRLDTRTHEYREIDQVGLEVLGDIDTTETVEIILLALKSLCNLDKDYALDISHMGILSYLLDSAAGDNITLKKQLAKCFDTKNIHDLKRICNQNGIDAKWCEKLCAVAQLDGNFTLGIQVLKDICDDQCPLALSELESIYATLETLGYADKVNLDFSIINDTEYYNGVVFRGYVSGIHRHILSGGRYDKLAGKFRQGVGAMGFAVYLTDLAAFVPVKEYDCDVLLLYKESDDPVKVIDTALKLRAQGDKVLVEKSIPDGIRYRQLKEI